jgi:PQQ-dependent dehydrogenase (methanol/ethanol family)
MRTNLPADPASTDRRSFIGRSNRLRRTLSVAVVAVVVVAGLAVALVTAGGSAGQSPEGSSDWSTFGLDYGQTRHVTADQITTKNLDRLGRVADVNLQKVDPSLPGGQQSYPLEIGGTLYVTTSFDHAFALDARTGRVRWHFAPSRIGAFKNFGVTANRGLAYCDGRLYMLTLDMRILALDPGTGKLVQQRAISAAVKQARPEFGYYESAAPVCYKGTLLLGSSGADNGVRGFVMAYHAKDLTPAWSHPYWTVPPEGQGWRRFGRFHGGGAVWMPVTIDTQTGIAYFSVSNPSPDFFPQLRPGPNPKTNSVVAVDVATGRERWWRQQLKHDQWDYDTGASPVLYNAKVGGKERKVVSVGTKEGYWYAYDTASGKPLYQRVKLIDRIDHPALKLGKPVIIRPSALGGQNYAPSSYSPQTNMLYSAASQTAGVLIQAKSAAQVNADRVRGDVDAGAINGFGSPVKGVKDYGVVSAIDLVTGKIAWKARTPQPERGGVTTTSTGLAFVGGGDGVLRAFDAKTGKLLWRFQTGAQIASAPTIYTLDGKEYLALTVGGTPTSSAGGKESRVQIFALGGSLTQSKAPQTTAPVSSGQAQTGSKYLSYGSNPNELNLTVVASQSAAGGGLNFNGFSRGRMIVRVPVGTTVSGTFKNASAEMPHSVVITGAAKSDILRAQGFKPVQKGAETPDPAVGITSGTQFFTFHADRIGRYAIVCAIPGHALGGMWDYLQVVPKGEAPSIKLGAKTITLKRRAG